MEFELLFATINMVGYNKLVNLLDRLVVAILFDYGT